jgi:hypothetical protein
MRDQTFSFVLSFLTMAACSEFVPDPNNPKDVCPSVQTDMPTCVVPDLATAAPKCAAAKGLTGDALICIDFDKVSGLSDQALSGWDFKTNCGAGWDIATGKLQVKNFGTFVGTCSFTMPLTDLASPANQKYQSVTLAVVQRVDLNSNPAVQQKAQPFLGLADPFRQIDFTTGSNPRQQKVYSLTRTDLATVSGVGTNFQPLFQLTSPVAAPGNTGWQIESIAVMGNP